MESGLIVLGIIVFLVILFPWQAAGFFAVVAIAWYLHNEHEKAETAKRAEEERLKHEAYVKDLIRRFGKVNADRILIGDIWVGQTQEMLLESRGHPGYIQQHQLKTKYKEVWSFDRVGKGKYSTSVTLENNIVTSYKI
jgi:hypothetical protein